MRLLGARDLNFTAKPDTDSRRVSIRIGTHRFIATRTEAIDLARQIVAAVDTFDKTPSTPDVAEEG